MKRIIITLLVFTLFSRMSSQPVYAQEFAFKVLASKGENAVSHDATGWKALKTGSKLSKEDKVKLAENSFLGLVHKSGKTLELKTPGTYSITDLSAKIGAATGSINQRYVDFVINEMTKEEKGDVNKNRHKNMGIEGKVERFSSPVTVLIPQKAIVLDNKPVIVWYAVEGADGYKITVANEFGEVLYAATTKDTSAVIDFTNPKLKSEENSYTVEVSLENKPHIKSNTYEVRRLDGAEAAAIQKGLKPIKTEDPENSLNKIIQASFFEENKLYLDAINSYQQAIRMQPDVDDYTLAYKQFLARHGLGK